MFKKSLLRRLQNVLEDILLLLLMRLKKTELLLKVTIQTEKTVNGLERVRLEIYVDVMKKIVIQDVEYVEASIVQKHAKDMSQLPAISLIHHHMFVITAHIKNSVIRINIFTVQSLQKQL